MKLRKLKNWDYPELAELAQSWTAARTEQSRSESSEKGTEGPTQISRTRWRMLVVVHGALFGISLSVAYLLIIPLIPEDFDPISSASAVISNIAESSKLPARVSLPEAVPDIREELSGIAPLWRCNGAVFTNKPKGMHGCTPVGASDMTFTSKHRFFTPINEFASVKE